MTERKPNYYEEAGLTRDQVVIMIQLPVMPDHIQDLSSPGLGAQEGV